MMFTPDSTALSLARPPYVTCAALPCAILSTLQTGSSITEDLMYYPGSWNPVKMVTATLAHTNFLHLFGDLVFFLAFASAVEVLVEQCQAISPKFVLPDL
jgi:membrane associated rhomboid family serine protease